MTSGDMLPAEMLKNLSACVDRDEIRQKLALYPRAVDRCDADLLRSIFWPDAIDDHGSFRGGLDALIDWSFPLLRQLDQTHHHIGNPAITLDGSIAETETYFIAYHRVPPGSGQRDFVIGGRYIDRFEKRDGDWRIALRRVAYDYNNGGDGVDWINLDFSRPHAIGGKMPNDPLYRSADTQ